ncbi:hypothetical protein AVL62_02805 [Serinicoccus chungangensis]|uniref:DUF559 domain-containing protein n=1 Tax=Serinicoccus chungangensis TaxID=767452 RepID=A0A0W8I6F8_9MICO|nr:hypothetical protein [Serinicoccus chungangensis]KUG53713.1 hypothetical protein AVL62_02805 [Serinicoccus chungangensis]
MGRDATHPTVRQLLQAQPDGVTTTDLHRLGVSDSVIRKQIAEGVLLRLRREVFVDRRVWDASAPWERDRLRARAVVGSSPSLGTRPGQVALSHRSAMAEHGLDVFGVDDEVHASRVGCGRGHRSGGLWVHAPVPVDQVIEQDGMPSVRPALASLQEAVVHGAEAGLVAADSALRARAATPEELRALVGLSCLQRDRPAARLVAELADGTRESAGESRTAWLLHLLGIAVECQVEIRDPSGWLVGRADFRVRGTRVLLEFDGRVKHTDRDVLVAEKLREDRLRELGYEVVRITWADLAHPHVVRARIRAALGRAASRRPA